MALGFTFSVALLAALCCMQTMDCPYYGVEGARGSLAVLLLLILFQCITFLCGQVTFVSGQVNGKYTCPKDKCLKKAMSSSDGWEEHFDLSTLLPYLKRDTRRYDCLADGVLCIIFCHGTMTNPSCKNTSYQLACTQSQYGAL